MTYLTDKVIDFRTTEVRAIRKAAWAACKDSRGVANRVKYEAMVEGALAAAAAKRAGLVASTTKVAAATTSVVIPVFAAGKAARMEEGKGLRVGNGVVGAKAGFGDGFAAQEKRTSRPARLTREAIKNLVASAGGDQAMMLSVLGDKACAGMAPADLQREIAQRMAERKSARAARRPSQAAGQVIHVQFGAARARKDA
jgi:hypothetical protein